MLNIATCEKSKNLKFSIKYLIFEKNMIFFLENFENPRFLMI